MGFSTVCMVMSFLVFALHLHWKTGVERMAESLEALCGNMSLTEAENVGITISEDATADLRMKGGK